MQMSPCASAHQHNVKDQMSLQGGGKKLGHQRNSRTHNCSKKLESKREKAGSAIICADWLQISYASISDKAGWKSQLHDKRADTDRVAVEGVQGMEDTDYLQQNQTLWIAIFSSHSTVTKTESNCTLALKILHHALLNHLCKANRYPTIVSHLQCVLKSAPADTASQYQQPRRLGMESVVPGEFQPAMRTFQSNASPL